MGAGLTSDHRARVEAAVLLAPIGRDPGPLRQVARGGRPHVDDLGRGGVSTRLAVAPPATDALTASCSSPAAPPSPRPRPRPHRLLQQLLQAVDVGPVPALTLHHHSVSAKMGRGDVRSPRSPPLQPTASSTSAATRMGCASRGFLTCRTSLGQVSPLWAHLLHTTRRGHRRRQGQHALSCSLPLSPVHLGATWESVLPPGPPTECAPILWGERGSHSSES